MYKNPYYKPEGMGLTTIADLELSEPNYGFDIVAVWRHEESGNYFWAHDAGCSCPTPFEQYTDISLLTPLKDQQSYDELASFVKNCYRNDYKQDFLRYMRELLEL